MAEYPRTAYILSLLGGILQLLIGVPLVVLGILLLIGGDIPHKAPLLAPILPIINMAPIIGAICLILPAIFGTLIINFAEEMKSAKSLKTIRSASITIVVLSIVGGLNIISLIGGILGLIWEPSTEAPQQTPSPPSSL